MTGVYNSMVNSNSPVKLFKAQALGVTNDTTLTLPAGAVIQDIIVHNNTANAITGGLKIGTTAGGVDVVLALAVGANAKLSIPSATILLFYFSKTTQQILYIEDVTAWNSANIDVTIFYMLV